MTLDEMRTAIYSNLDDRLKSLYDEEALRLKINSAMRFVWNELNKRGKYFNVMTETVSFTADNQEITISGDIHTLIWVKDAEKINLDVTDDAQAQRTDRRSVYLSRAITVSGTTRTRVTKLGYYIVPDSAFDLTIKYNQQITVFPTNVTGSELYEDIPVEHHNVIVLYATILCLPRYHEDSQQWQQLYGLEFDNLADVYETVNVNDMAVVDVNDAQYTV